MTNGTCAYAGCSGPVRAKGWCSTHYNRYRQWGTPDGSGLKRGQRLTRRTATTTLAERFEEKLVQGAEDECWGFKSALITGGYHMISHKMAHRVAYELYVGPIPAGLLIDHVCCNRACVNPRHLRLATTKQNAENRAGKPAHSTRPYRGVAWVPKRKCWEVKVRHNGKDIWGGYFASPDVANQAAIALRNQFFTHNTERHAA